jgi:hypothetical protein
MRSLALLILLMGSACSSLEAEQECSAYTLPITVGGQPEQSDFVACLQADDSLRVIQTTPGLPTQEYTVPPYDADAHTPL